MKTFFPIEVTRPDAGGPLWAPGKILNNAFVETGETPSHDYEVIRRRCDQLNEAPRNAPTRKAGDLFDALLLATTDADKLREFARSLAGRMDNDSIEDLFAKELWAFDKALE